MLLPTYPLIGSPLAAAAYEIERGLLCDGSSYLSRTPGSAGNRKAITVNIGVKRAKLGTTQYVFSAGAASTDYFAVFFDTSDRLNIIRVISSTTDAQKTSNAVFRDLSAWGMLTVILDAANTSLKAFYNGVELTWSTSNDPSNVDGPENNTVLHTIGARSYSQAGTYFDGYIAEPRILDGVAPADDTDFGQSNSTTGQWVWRTYNGLYGAQGARLLLDNPASTTTLGEDASGNGNDWTLTGFTTADSVEDTPTNNFCVWNALASNYVSDGAVPTLSEGNLGVVTGTTTRTNQVGTHPIEGGKWYFEIDKADTATNLSLGVASILPFASGDQTTVASYASGVWRVCIDYDAGKLWVTQSSSNSDMEAGANEDATFSYSGPVFPAFREFSSSVSTSFVANFGQKPFAHTPPAGFKALSTANLTNPGEASPRTGSFTGNANADGPFVWLGYPPDKTGTCTINGNAITWGTHADALANGFKLRTSSASYNAAGSNTYSIAIDANASFADNANAQVN